MGTDTRTGGVTAMSTLTRREFGGILLAGGAAAGDLFKTLRPAHPRLMLTDDALARIKRLIQSEPHPRRWYASIRAEADEVLGQPPSRHEIPDGLRLLSVSRRVKERVQTLALAYRIEGDRRYRDRIWTEIEAAAGFKDWNPRHFLDTAEMTYAFAVAYDWLYADWSAQQRRAMCDAMVRLGLKPGLEVYRSPSGWHTNVNNWNQVCNGGLGIGALALADQEPQLAADILGSALRSLPLAMSHYAPDGAGTEGATYWDYGARFNILLLSSLETALGTDFGLSQTEGFRQSGAYQIYLGGADRMALDFADCGLRRLSTPMHFWMARKFKRPEYSWYRLSELARADQNGNLLDLLWYDASGRDFDTRLLPLDKYFRRAECVSVRSGWDDPKALVVALQAGENNDLRGHRHLDLGTFILEALGERWIIDSGVEHETYLTHRHHNPRWSYYRVRAEGHNTLAINPDQGPDQEMKAAAKVTSFDSRPDRVTAVVDLSQAYARHARRVERTLAVVNRSSVIITDRVLADTPAEVWWFAQTGAAAAASADRRKVTLAQNGKRFLVEIVEPATAAFEVQEAAPLPTSPNPAGQTSNQGRLRLAIRLSGVRDLKLTVKFSPAV